jgi:hypothetical protein
MRIEDLIAGKKDNEEVRLDWTSLPVAALKKLTREGYDYVTFYRDNRTFSIWGKNCSACFTEQQIRER